VKKTMTVVITGANGFVGSWLVKFFVAQGNSVIGLTRPHSNDFRLHGVKEASIIAIDPSEWPALIRDLAPETLLLGDWAGVAGHEANSKLQRENSNRWSELAHAAAESRVRTVFAFGSQAELGQDLNGVTETTEHNPLTEYGKAKSHAYFSIRSALSDSSTRLIWGRIFAVFGPLDNENWLIPSVIRSLKSGLQFNTTLGEQIWNFLYIEDLCRAVHSTLQHENFQGTLNLASPQTIQIRTLLEYIQTSLGKEGLINFGGLPYSANQIMVVNPNTSLLTSMGWSPQFTIEEAIQRLLVEDFFS
jgi:UDP-glucose 4-epimerase